MYFMAFLPTFGTIVGFLSLLGPLVVPIVALMAVRLSLASLAALGLVTFDIFIGPHILVLYFFELVNTINLLMILKTLVGLRRKVGFHILQ